MAKVTIRAGSIAKALGASRRSVANAVHEGLAKTGAHLEREIKLAYRGAGLKRRTGRLIGSIGFIFKGALSMLVGTVRSGGGQPLVYARQREFGGTIHGNPWLAIPLPTVKTQAGVTRAYARDYRDHPEQFGFKGTFVAKGVIFGYLAKGHGKGITGERSKVVPLFALRRSVTQPARPFIVPTVKRELPVAQEKFMIPLVKRAVFGTPA